MLAQVFFTFSCYYLIIEHIHSCKKHMIENNETKLLKYFFAQKQKQTYDKNKNKVTLVCWKHNHYRQYYMRMTILSRTNRSRWVLYYCFIPDKWGLFFVVNHRLTM